jgi:hypothetical protein
MATFTSLDDNTVLRLTAPSDIFIAISGTYDMVIEYQREQGSYGSNSWQMIREYKTPNATISESYSHTNIGTHHRYRLIVTSYTSGTATATLTSEVVATPDTDAVWGEIAGDITDQTDLISLLDDATEWGNLTGDIADQTDLQTALDDKVDSAGAQLAAQAFLESLSGVQDATTALLGNQTWGLVNPATVSGGEITAGTEVALRSYSPANIKSFITTHAPGSSSFTLTNDANAAVTIGDAITGTHRRLTHATPALTLDAQATVGTIVAATPAGGTGASVAVEAGATYFTAAADQSAAGATTSFNIKGFAVFECMANADNNSAKWFVAGDTDLAETTDGALLVVGTLEVDGQTNIDGAFDCDGAADFSSTVTISGTTNIDGALDIDGAVDISTTVTLSGSANVVGAAKVVADVELKDIGETVNAIGNTSGGVSIDYTSGGVATYTLTGNQTSLTITNPPATGKAGSITLIISQDGTRTAAWGAAFRFPGGTDFVLTTGASAVDIYTFITIDGGTTWYGFEGGKAFAA